MMFKSEFLVLCSMLSCVSSFAQDAVDVDKIPFDKIGKAKIEVIGLRNGSSLMLINASNSDEANISLSNENWEQKHKMGNLYVTCILYFKKFLAYEDSFVTDGNPRTDLLDGTDTKDEFGVPGLVRYEIKHVYPIPGEERGLRFRCSAIKGIDSGRFKDMQNIIPTLGDVKKATAGMLKITLEQASK